MGRVHLCFKAKPMSVSRRYYVGIASVRAAVLRENAGESAQVLPQQPRNVRRVAPGKPTGDDLFRAL